MLPARGNQTTTVELITCITRQNYRFLSDMWVILRHFNVTFSFPNSLNKNYREREQERIARENIKIAQHLQYVKPRYDTREWVSYRQRSCSRAMPRGLVV